MPKRILFILPAFIHFFNAAGQIAISDSNVQKTVDHTIDIYYNALGDQSPLYNGSEYLDYAYTIQEGHPYFESTAFVKGNIHFDGMEFLDVPMIYDIVKDQVIIQHFKKIYRINLPAEKIESFTLSGHSFIRIISDSSHPVKTGFYDKLYSGKIMLLAKREKKLREDHELNQITNIVDQKNYYYIEKEGVYYNFRNMNMLMSILQNKKNEIQQYFKKNKIRYKDDPERAMIIAAEYYDRLTN